MILSRPVDDDLPFYLICFDKNGVEQSREDGTSSSAEVLQALAENAPSDIFLLSHGWMGDVPAAIDQYRRWIGAFTALKSDSNRARRADTAFRPLIIGLHWPSLPWGDETVPSGDSQLLGAESNGFERELDLWQDRIADTPPARAALETILRAATETPELALSQAVRAAYQRLFDETGLLLGDQSGRPGADQESFDIDKIIADSPRFSPSGPGVLGGTLWTNARDLVLAPLRTLSFWKMKDRARRIGEWSAHKMLVQLQQSAANARFHLMGHSFGCIVLSSAVAGESTLDLLARPVDTLFLVQGAMSLWGFAEMVPYADQKPGYFRRIIDEDRVRGSIVTTTSRFDTAVGRYYPIGTHFAFEYVLSAEYPKYGGVGTYGIQGVSATSAVTIHSADEPYEFSASCIYNIDASRIICHGGGTSGAHSDIAHPEVAHILWSAVLSTFAPSVSELEISGQGAVDSGEDDGDDAPPSVGGGLLSAENDPRSAFAHGDSNGGAPRPSADDDTRGTSFPGWGGVASSVPPIAAPASPPHAAGEGSRDQPLRYVTAEIEDREPTKPLVPEHWYTLSFGIDLQASDAAIAAVPLADIPFAAGEDSILVSVELSSNDFSIAVKMLPLRIERSGASSTRARFGISPVRKGKSVIQATLHKDGNFIQALELTFDVAAQAAAQVKIVGSGRPISAADGMRPRVVTLRINPRDDYYECEVLGCANSRARLEITADYLASEIKLARQALLNVVTLRKGNVSPFQKAVSIGKDENAKALEQLAAAGARLYRKLFFAPGAGVDSIALGELLRKLFLEGDEVLDMQVAAEKLPVPWSLLYLDTSDGTAPLSWDNFLGFRHIVEQIPLQNSDPVRTPVITSSPALALGTQLNTRIDTDFNVTLVADQVKFWSDPAVAKSGIRVSQRSSRKEVFEALCDAGLPDQILYFYCHAVSYDLTEKLGPGSSKLTFTDGEITLDQLQTFAPITRRMSGRPLVFINACESAELSAQFYDGFVPYFIARGARGVMGTECNVPALFAADWAREFFKMFLNGRSLGEVVYKLRKKYLDEQANPLGLLYAVYCDPNTQIKPGLAIGA